MDGGVWLELVLVRHGETIANLKHKYSGHLDTPLSENGIDQTHKLVDRLKKEEFDKVFSSPLSRTKIIAELAEVDAIYDSRLKEFNFGCFEGLDYVEAKAIYPQMWEEWVKQDENYVVENGESLSSFERRVNSFLDECVDLNAKRILIISHGGVIRTILAKFLELDETAKWHINIANASYVKMRFVDGYVLLEELVQIDS